MVMMIYKDWGEDYDVKLNANEWWVNDWEWFNEFLCCTFKQEWTLEEFMAELQKDIDEEKTKDELREKWLVHW